VQAGMRPVSSLKVKKPAGSDLGSFLMICRNFFDMESLNKTLNLLNQQKISLKNMKSVGKS
jgi:hypothetical protein